MRMAVIKPPCVSVHDPLERRGAHQIQLSELPGVVISRALTTAAQVAEYINHSFGGHSTSRNQRSIL